MSADRIMDPRETFSGSAERYLTSTDHGSGPDLELIGSVADRLSPALTVDVATGAGYALKAAAPVSRRCLALDLTLEMLQVTRRHFMEAGIPGLSVVQASADNIPLGDGTIGLLTCRIAPHHFPSLAPFLEEVNRVLDGEGEAVIIDSVVPDDPECDRFLNDVERQRDPSHVRSGTVTEWEKLISQAGLETIFFDIFSRTHPFQEWARRVGLADDGVKALEDRFIDAPPSVKELFKIEVIEGKVMSYTDEKGMWVLKPAGR